MPRPLAVIGITFFFTLTVLCISGDSYVLPLLCISVAGAVIFLLVKQSRKQAVLPCAAITMAAACLLFAATYERDYIPAISAAGSNVTVEAEIVDLPYTKDGKYKYTLKDAEDRKILLTSKKKLRAKPYDTLKFTGDVYVLGGDNDEIKDYYRSKSVWLGAYTSGEIAVKSSIDRPLMFHVLMLRKHILDSVTKYLPGDEGGIVSAILLGNRSYISHSTIVGFSDTGVLHIFAVSGLHVTVWSMFILAIFDKLRFGRIISSLLTAVFVLLFIALTGFSESCLRAGIMMLVILMGRIISKEADAINSLGLALILICAFNPLGADNIGLWLSFLSCFGILVLFPASSEYFREKFSSLPPRRRKLLLSLMAKLTVSAAAAIFTLPAAVMAFERVSLIAPLTNLLVVPAAEICMISGGIIPVFANAGFLSFLSRTAAFISGMLAKYLIFVTDAFAKLPFSSVSAGEKYIKLWLALVIILVAVSIIMSRLQKRTMRFVSVMCVFTLLVGMLSFEVFNQNLAEISVLNVGNGSAVLVTAPGSKAMLIGCGGDYFAADTVSSKLRQAGVRKLDFLLLPRAKQTEMNAALDLLSEVEAKRIAAPRFSENMAELDFSHNIIYSEKFFSEPWQGAKLKYACICESYAAYLEINSVSALILFSPGTDVSLLPQEWLGADILCCRQSLPEILNGEKYGLTVISGDGAKAERAAAKINSRGGKAYTTAYNVNVTIKINADSVCRVEME